MSKLATRCSVILIASGLSGLLTGCPQQQPPSTIVKPIPSSGTVPIPSPTPSDSVIVTPTPGPGSSSNPGGTPSSAPEVPPSNPQPGDGQLAISTTTLPTSAINFNYSVPLQVLNGSGSYRWSIVSGNLPTGLSLDPTSGIIFGKASQTGTFSFEAQVVDNQKGTVAKRTMFILVSDTDNGQINNLVVLTDSLPTAVVDRRYSKILDITGGTAPVSWDITSGALPDGLSLNSKTGEISGTPTLKGEETFTVRVTDSRGQSRSRTLSLTVNATDSNITILTTSLPIAVTGQHFDFTLAGSCAQFDPSLSARFKATGGSGLYRWSISSGTQPAGMDSVLQTESNTSSALYNTGFFATSGDTPNAVGTYTFTVKVQDESGNSASKVFTIETRSSAVYGFSPSTGSKGLNVRLFGTGLTGATNVAFGNVTSPATLSAGTCDQVNTKVPANAQAGLLTVNGAANSPMTTSPFIPEDVVISEVFFTPASGEKQFIELKNLSATSVNLGGWYLTYTKTDGTLEKLAVPSQTLNSGATTFVELNNEMRFDPENATAANALTRIALCKGAPCDDVNDANQRFRFRDYLQFGPAAATDGGILENDASANAGIWTNDATINMTAQVAPIGAVNGTFGNASVAHYGVFEPSFASSGLLLTNGTTEYSGYSGDSVLYFTPSGGAQSGVEQRIKRTFTGVGAAATASQDRVRFNSSFYQAGIKSTNTGDGTVGKGIQVDDISLFSPNDFINVVTGSAIRTISQIVGQTIEMTTGLSADVASANLSDGTTTSTVATTVTGGGAGPVMTLASTANMYVGSTLTFSATNDIRQITAINGNQVTLSSALSASVPNGSTASLTVAGLLVGANQSQFFGSGSTVNVIVHSGQTGQFTVSRTISSIPDASHVVLNQALATAAVDASNIGDGTAGNEIKMTSAPNFQTGDLVLYKGQPCVDGQPCTVTVGTGGTNPQFRLNQPLQTLAISDTNTGDGTTNSKLEVDSINGLTVGDVFLYKGVTRTIATLTPGFGSTLPQVVLSTPLSLSISGNNKGDGSSATFPIEIVASAGFQTGSKVSYFGQSCVINTLLTAGVNPAVILDCDLATAGVQAPADAAQAQSDASTANTSGLGTTASPFHLKNINANYQLNLVGKNFMFPADFTSPLCPPPVGTGTACPFHSISKFTATGASSADIEFSTPLTAAVADGTAVRFIPVTGSIMPQAQAATTVSGGDGSTGTPVAVASAANFSVGQNVFFTANSQIRQITNIAGNNITLNVPLSTAISSGKMISQAEFAMNVIPKLGSFTLVPNPNPNPPFTSALTNPTQILSIPTSGNIYLAPKSGTVRKYQSLTFTATLATEAGTAGDYGVAAPTKGN